MCLLGGSCHSIHYRLKQLRYYYSASKRFPQPSGAGGGHRRRRTKGRDPEILSPTGCCLYLAYRLHRQRLRSPEKHHSPGSRHASRTDCRRHPLPAAARETHSGKMHSRKIVTVPVSGAALVT